MLRFNFLTRKGVYLYEYLNDFSKFDQSPLGAKDKFYSCSSDEHIGDEYYSHAQNVRSTFVCKNLSDYHDLYLKTDVNLLHV